MSIFERFKKQPEATKGSTPIPDFEEAMKNMPKNPTNFNIPEPTKEATPKDAPEHFFKMITDPEDTGTLETETPAEKSLAEQYGITPIEPAEAPKDATPEQLAELKRQRIERKVIGTLMAGDLDLMQHEDLSVSDKTRQAFLEKIKNGQIALKQEYEIVKYVYPNYFEHGSSLFRGLQLSRFAPLHQAVLGYMTEGPAGLNNFRKVNSNNFFDFTQKYKDAISFDQPSADFLGMLKTVGSTQFDNFTKSISQLKKQIYGEQQEYLDVIKALNAEAAAEN